jgi:hypothetical protein
MMIAIFAFNVLKIILKTLINHYAFPSSPTASHTIITEHAGLALPISLRLSIRLRVHQKYSIARYFMTIRPARNAVRGTFYGQIFSTAQHRSAIVWLMIQPEAVLPVTVRAEAILLQWTKTYVFKTFLTATLITKMGRVSLALSLTHLSLLEPHVQLELATVLNILRTVLVLVAALAMSFLRISVHAHLAW